MVFIVKIENERETLDYTSVNNLIGYHGSISPIQLPDLYKEFVCFPDVNEPDKKLHCVYHKSWDSAKGYGFTILVENDNIIQRPLTISLPKGRKKNLWTYKIENILDQVSDQVYVIVAAFLANFPSVSAFLAGKFSISLELFKDVIIRGDYELWHPWIIGLIYFMPNVLHPS